MAVEADDDADAARSEPRVLLERQKNGVALVTLNRPKKRNGLDVKMFHALAETAVTLADDRSVRAVVLHGAGDAFCAGLDVKSFAELGPLSAARAGAALLKRTPADAACNPAQDAAWLWRRIPAPVIAAVHGVCLGGGLQIALGADVRFASPDARFSVMEAKWGIVPDMGGAVFLRELVPRDVAMELTMSARIVGADEARRVGLVSHVADDPLAAALALAAETAEYSPDALAAAKELLDAAYAHGEGEREVLARETATQKRLLAGRNQVTAALRNFTPPGMYRVGYAARSYKP